MKQKGDSVRSNTQKGIREAKEVDDLKVHLFRTSVTDLPYDIITSILFLLPIKSILICKSVCKEWYTIISDPHFAQWHAECAPINVLVRMDDSRRVSRTLHLLDFEHKGIEAQNLVNDNDCGHICSCKDSLNPNCSNHTKLEVKFKLPLRDSKMVLDTMLETRNEGRKKNFIACKPKEDRFDVVNSCNGLLCLCDPADKNPLVICNPITGEFTRLPEASKKVRLRDTYNCGFGYLKKANEYKVVRICNRYVQRRGSEYLSYIHTIVEIHTLGQGLWRKMKYHTHWLGFRFPTSLNGSLHWLVFNHKGVSILCFDLESETFNLFPSPHPLSSMKMKEKRSIEAINFGEVKRSLYISCAFPDCLTFWTMKTYGVGQSWTKVLNFNINHWDYWLRLVSPITYFVGAGILIYHPCRYFIYHEPQKHVFKFFEVRGTYDVEPILYIPSLIKLKDAVKEGSIEVLNFHSRCATFNLREEKEILFMAKCNADLEDGLSDHAEEYSFLRS